MANAQQGGVALRPGQTVSQQRNPPGGTAPMGAQPMGQQSTQPSLATQSAGAFNGAIAGTRDAMQYQPMNVTAQDAGMSRVNAGSVQAGQIGSTNLQPYMNPYTTNVVNSTMQDMRRANQMALNDVGAAAGASGAFGGSRHGLVEGQTNNGFTQQVGQMSAGLRQAGFQNAQQMAGSDIDRRMQAGQYNASIGMQGQLANQAANMQNQQFNASQNMQAQLANQSAGLNGAGQRLGAAGQLGNLGNMGFGMGQQITQTQMQQGAQQQALMQQLIDASKAQYGGWTGAPQNGLATQIGAASGSPFPQSTTESKSPGLLNILSMGLGLL